MRKTPLAGGVAQGSNQKTDTAIIRHKLDADNVFAPLRARAALAGHSLHRTSPVDGPVAYYAERCGLVRYLPTLEDVERFVAQTGGQPDDRARARSLQARYGAYLEGIVRASAKNDKELAAHYASCFLGVAEQMAAAGMQPGLDNPLEDQ